jgi:Zn-dependent M28 family amino/carboxypeptidase
MADGELPQRLKAHVTALAGVIGARGAHRPDAYAAARDYVRRELTGAGYRVAEQPFPCGGTEAANLEVVRTGRNAALPCLVVGAHYDTVPGSPGADDNASGVAALIEIARALWPLAPERDVRLVAFANEEAPFFAGPEQGSMAYVARLRERGTRVHRMASLEMLGYFDATPGSQQYPPLMKHLYPDRADFIGLVGNLASRGAVKELAAAFRAAGDFPCETLAAPEWVPGVALSDQYAFWRAGVPAVMVTDTAFYRNPHYHAASDLPDTLDYAGLAAVTAGLAGAFARLAGAWPA